MNSVSLIGRTTKNIEIRSTTSGKTVVAFTLAVERTDKKVDYVPCEAWGKTAELLSTYIHKGDQVGIEGQIVVSSYDDPNIPGKKVTSVKVLVNSITFCAKAKGKEVIEKEVVETSDAFDTVDDLVNQLSSDELPF